MSKKEKNLRSELKQKLKNRQLIFGGWVSFSHPSITEIFSEINLDFMAIDIEHSTINFEQTQRIISSSQGLNVPCLPRPVSYSNDIIKPILDSGADGLIIPTVNNKADVDQIINNMKYPTIGKRTYGINRAQSYGFETNNYFESWNKTSNLIVQIETKEGVENIEEILSSSWVDGVMIGPYDLSGSYGKPGDLNHPDVINASKTIVKYAQTHKKSCGTQISDPNDENVKKLVDFGYNFIILSSDLFILYNWAKQMDKIINKFS